MPASRPPRIRTPSTAATSPPGRRACRSPSISPPTAAMTATIRAWSATSARRAWRSTRVEDMKILFDGIPLDEMSVSMTMNGAVLPVMAFYIVAAEEQGVAQAQLDGHDPERHPQGVRGPQHLYLPARALDADRRRHHRLLRARTCRSSTRSRSAAITCTRPGRRRCRSSPSPSPTAWNMSGRRRPRGSTSTHFAPRLSFFFGIGMNFFMEVAKLRAARLLWHRIMDGLRREERQVEDAAHPLPDLGRVSLTEQDPYNNVIRTTIEAMAAVLGGTQSLHTNSFDEAIALPTDFSARIARNTQLVLAEESGITNVADPLGGSYYVEALTSELADKAWALIEEVEGARRHDRRGRRGHAQAPDRGSRRRARRAGRPRRDGDRRRQPLPAQATSRELDILEVDNARVRAGQIARLEKVRAGRDEAAAQAALDALREGATRRRQSARSVDRGGAGALHARRDLVRAGGRVRPLRHHARAGQRHLWRRLCRRPAMGAGRAGRRGDRPPARAQAAHAGRQDGPGRPRPRRQPGRLGLRRSRLRGGARAAVPDARRKARSSRSTRMSTWSAPPASPPATRRWSPS